MRFEDHYSVLGVARDSSPLNVRKAYRRLVLRYHPDRNPGDAAAEEQFKRIVTAYQVISDREKRAEYDSRLSALQDATARAQEEAFLRQKERAELRRAERLRRMRRQAPGEDSSPVSSETNELDSRDLRNGMIAGTVAVLAWTALSAGPVIPTLVCLAIPFFTTPAGYRLGQNLGSRLDIRASDSIVPDVNEIAARLIPGLCSWMGAWCAERAAVWFGLPSGSGLVLPVSLGAGLATATGSAFGRAFTSVARRFSAKLVGIAVGVGVSVCLGVLLALVLVTFTCGLRLGANSNAMFELIFVGAATTGLAAGAASLPGSLRPL